jgi:hypothetical protein
MWKQHMILMLNIEEDAEAEQQRCERYPCTFLTERRRAATDSGWQQQTLGGGNGTSEATNAAAPFVAGAPSSSDDSVVPLLVKRWRKKGIIVKMESSRKHRAKGRDISFTSC